MEERLRTIEHEYWCGEGLLWPHFREHGLADEQGFDPVLVAKAAAA